MIFIQKIFKIFFVILSITRKAIGVPHPLFLSRFQKGGLFYIGPPDFFQVLDSCFPFYTIIRLNLKIIQKNLFILLV